MLPRFWLKRLQQLSFFDTFKHASTYFSASLLIHALGILTLPIFTAYLTDAEYGLVNVFTSYVLVIAVLATLNLHWAVSRYYFEEGQTDFDAFFGTIFLGVTAIFMVLGGMMLYWEVVVADVLNLPVHLIKWLVGMAYLAIVFSLFTQLMVATQKSKKLGTVQVIWHYGRFVLTVLGLMYFVDTWYVTTEGEQSSYTYMGKIIGEFVGTALITAYAFRQIVRHMSFKNLRWRYIQYSLRFGLPLIPFALSNYILTSFDQWYILSEVGEAETGQYAFAYKIALLYVGLGTALIDGANPSYYAHMNKGEHEQVRQQVDSMTKLLVLGGGFLMFFAVDAGTLLSSNKDLLNALPLTPVIVAAYLFHGIGSFANRGIYFKKKNAYLATIILTSGVANILLNGYFIKQYGFGAAAYTTLASYILMMVLSLGVTTYILKLPPLPIGRILKYIVLLGAVLLIYYQWGQPYVGLDPLQIVFKGALWVALGVALFYNKIGLLLRGDAS